MTDTPSDKHDRPTLNKAGFVLRQLSCNWPDGSPERVALLNAAREIEALPSAVPPALPLQRWSIHAKADGGYLRKDDNGDLVLYADLQATQPSSTNAPIQRYDFCVATEPPTMTLYEHEGDKTFAGMDEQPDGAWVRYEDAARVSATLPKEETTDSEGDWQCRDYGDGWITFPDRKAAEKYQQDTGAMMRYRRFYPASASTDGSGAPCACYPKGNNGNCPAPGCRG